MIENKCECRTCNPEGYEKVFVKFLSKTELEIYNLFIDKAKELINDLKRVKELEKELSLNLSKLSYQRQEFWEEVSGNRENHGFEYVPKYKILYEIIKK